jgi:hypothetical protein
VRVKKIVSPSHPPTHPPTHTHPHPQHTITDLCGELDVSFNKKVP